MDNKRSKSITPFRNTQFQEQYPYFSPDGRWLVYTSDKEGRSEVYVAPPLAVTEQKKSLVREEESLVGQGVENSCSIDLLTVTRCGLSMSKPERISLPPRRDNFSRIQDLEQAQENVRIFPWMINIS